MNDPSEDSLALLQDLSSFLGLDHLARSEAMRLFHSFRDTDSTWVTSTQDSSKAKSVVRCAIYVALKEINGQSQGMERNTGVSVTQLLKGPQATDLHSFMFRLKEFAEVISLEEHCAGELQQMFNSFAFSLMLFTKFEEIWTKLELSDVTGREENIMEIKQFAWLLYLIVRVNILQRRTDLVECACMLIGVLYCLVTTLPANVTSAFEGRDKEAVLQALAGIPKANPEQARFSADHVFRLLETLKTHDHIRGVVEAKAVDGMLTMSNIRFNTGSLHMQYQSKMLPFEIDEREFLYKETKLSTPLKKRGFEGQSDRKSTAQRVLQWEEDSGPNINSKLSEFKFPSIVSNSPYSIHSFPPSSRLSSDLAMKTWVLDHTANPPLDVLQNYCEACDKGLYDQILQRMEGLKEDFYQSCQKFYIVLGVEEEERKTTETDKPELASKLYITALSQILKNEEKRLNSSNFASFLSNDSFHQALYCCCIRAVLLAFDGVKNLRLEDLLEICRINAFDWWKLIKSFTTFDPKIPNGIRQDFQTIEEAILTSLIWAQSSPVPHIIRQYFQSPEDSEVTKGIFHPSFKMLCRRLLEQAAQRLFDISQQMGFSEDVQEQIWSALKYALSQETELLISRHLDQVVVCTIYGVCKACGTAQVTFNSLILKYSEMIQDNGMLFRNVRLMTDFQTGDIINFYNNVYVGYMKTYLLALNKSVPIQGSKPRIQALNPDSPLKEHLPQPLLKYSASPQSAGSSITRSPSRLAFLTPRTRRLYAFGESPSQALESINRMMQKSDRKINFDQEDEAPTKKPKYMSKILQGGETIENAPAPTSFPSLKTDHTD